MGQVMNASLLRLSHTLQHLGDVTSRNLEFSYSRDAPVSYGEETITESNLLELRRRHSDVLRLLTFSKYQESKSGADWEWHIVGHRRTLKMRVQAKRVQRNDVLKIRHTVARSGMQQQDLLIKAAKARQMRPMYCIYCTEPQRSIFRKHGPFQTGCLLADAGNLPLHTRYLSSIEWACWPWHYLFEAFPPIIQFDYFLPRGESGEIDHEFPLPPPQPLEWNAPRILDLNEDTEWKYNPTGVEDTTPLDIARVDGDGTEELQRADEYNREQQLDEGVRGVVVIDVRSQNPEHTDPT